MINKTKEDQEGFKRLFDTSDEEDRQLMIDYNEYKKEIVRRYEILDKQFSKDRPWRKPWDDRVAKYKEINAAVMGRNRQLEDKVDALEYKLMYPECR